MCRMCIQSWYALTKQSKENICIGYIYSKITTQSVFVHHQRYFHVLTGINLFWILDLFSLFRRHPVAQPAINCSKAGSTCHLVSV